MGLKKANRIEKNNNLYPSEKYFNSYGFFQNWVRETFIPCDKSRGKKPSTKRESTGLVIIKWNSYNVFSTHDYAHDYIYLGLLLGLSCHAFPFSV